MEIKYRSLSSCSISLLLDALRTASAPLWRGGGAARPPIATEGLWPRPLSPAPAQHRLWAAADATACPCPHALRHRPPRTARPTVCFRPFIPTDKTLPVAASFSSFYDDWIIRPKMNLHIFDQAKKENLQADLEWYRMSPGRLTKRIH